MPTPCVEAKGEKKRQANIYGIGHMASDQIRSDQIRSDQIRSYQIAISPSWSLRTDIFLVAV